MPLLRELTEVDKLRELIAIFYKAFPIALAISDADGEWLVKEGWSECCTKFLRVHPKCQEICLNSNELLNADLKLNNYCFSTCGHGLIDVAAPIIVDGQKIATLWLGQFFSSPPDLEHYRQYAKKFGFPEDEFLQSIAACPIYNPEEVERQARFFIRLCELLVEAGLQHQGRLKAEEALARSERDFRSLAENSPDNIARWDAAGRYVYINPTCERTIGASIAEIRGKRIGEAFPAKRHSPLETAIDKVVATGQSELFVREPVPAGNGEIHIHDINLVPEFDDTGQVVSVLGMGRNMTNVYRLQEEIAIRECEFRSLAESSPDAIIRYDIEQRIRYLNSRLVRDMQISSVEEVIGKRPIEVWPDGRFSAIEETAARVSASGSPAIVETVCKPEPGQIRIRQVSVVPDRDVDGRIIGTIAFGRDITTIREDERRLKHFIENLPGMAYSFRLSPDGHASFPYVSPAIEDLYGLKPEDVREDMAPLHDLAHPDDQLRIEKAIALSASTMRPFHIEFRVLRPGHPERWLECRSIPERHADGSVLWNGIMLDITERKRIQQELELLDHAINQSSDAVFLLDEKLRFNYVNGTACRSLGYDRKELLTMTFLDIDLHVSRDACLEAIRSPADIGERYVFESIHRAKDGRTFPVELGSSVVLHRGQKFGLVLARDISERKALDAQLAEERSLLEQRVKERTAALKDSEQRFLRLVNDIGDQFLIFSFEPTGGLLHVSDGIATVMGCHREDVIGRKWIDKFDWLPGEVERGKDKFGHLAEGTLDFSQIELAFRHPDGDVRTLQVHAHAVRNAKGIVTGIDGIAEDVTERNLVEVELRKAKKAAEAADRSKSQFLAAASHDLRQPIQAINLYLSTLCNTALDAQQQKIGDRLTAAAASLSGMLDGILDISKLEAGVIKSEEIPIELFDVIEKLENECVPLLAARQLKFKLFFPVKTIVLRTDPTLLLAMLRNIIGNAIKYTEEGGVLVGVRERRSHLDFEVWDTGLGIPADDLPRIFDEFVQLGNPQRDRTKGLGLGLATVKRLATLTGYKVTCKSRLGRGTVFKVRVPLDRTLTPDALPAYTVAPEESDGYPSLAGLSVVLIEDDSLVAQALTEWLAAQGVRVVCYTDGTSALASPDISEADVYISDFRLPGNMTGAEVLDAIQQTAGRPINGIIITGDTAAEKVSGLAKTRWTFFHKPIKPERLALVMAAMQQNLAACRDA